jgi:tRNA pseudouridine55 synthase
MSAARRPPRRQVDGVLLLDKPSGLTSNGALGRVKRLYNPEKAGHTGTLDPLASGLLPICMGAATRFAQFLLDAPKRYVATVRFGVATTTQDADGEVVESRPVAFDRDALVAVLPRFSGRQMQVPPAHSALKFQGKPYYDYARKGIDIPRVAREVSIHALRLLEWNAPDATFEVECSKGTYVRALAADLGEALGCGAHLAALRRTGSGGFDVENAVTLDALDAISEAQQDACLLPASVMVAHLPRIDLDRTSAAAFLHGQSVITTAGTKCAAAAGVASVQAVYGPDGLLGVAEVCDGIAKPRRSVSTAPGSGPITRAGCP